MIRRKKWRLSGAALNSLNVQARTHREKDKYCGLRGVSPRRRRARRAGWACVAGEPPSGAFTRAPPTDRLRRRIRDAVGGTLVHFREQFLEPRL